VELTQLGGHLNTETSRLGEGVHLPNPRPPYPPEFRAEAVRLYRTSGKSLKTVCEDLGISLETLRSWVKRAEIDTGEREGVSTEEELRVLRRRVKVLEEEKQILKKAAAFFARDHDLRP